MSEQKTKDKYEVLSVKIKPDQAVLLNAICNALGVNTYQIFQMFFYTLCKASAPMHELSPDIRKLMTLMETDASWAEAFNLANPNKLKVAQCILILEQEKKKGFGVVMIDRPLMKAPDKVDELDPDRANPQMTENVDNILERVAEVTMHGIYRRLRLIGGSMDCNKLSDILLTMIDAQTVLDMEEESRVEMQGDAQYDIRGRRIEYGKKTKSRQHRTPDSYASDQRIMFDDFDRDTANNETQEWEGEHRQTDTPPDGIRPYDVEW